MADKRDAGKQRQHQEQRPRIKSDRHIERAAKERHRARGVHARRLLDHEREEKARQTNGAGAKERQPRNVDERGAQHGVKQAAERGEHEQPVQKARRANAALKLVTETVESEHIEQQVGWRAVEKVARCDAMRVDQQVERRGAQPTERTDAKGIRRNEAKQLQRVDGNTKHNRRRRRKRRPLELAEIHR